ncbi:arginine-hydroxylase NDUFAF5, mitochondrial [Neocloeon triangulifer]|uniref:arginine-hydroxylase NDUFAF5, mitochondrial n=1 Tax=Neocloeon triangulifer TaxID=2078957 RepID=UPI00286F0007|nr:arginine-hydroxylase NDUFAF5, mitochondrial [Neocloeon triangulifer]
MLAVVAARWPLVRMSWSRAMSMNIFDRSAKLRQRERAAHNPDVALFDYVKDEIGYRLADRVFDIKRQFRHVVDLGCGRGHVSQHISADNVTKLTMCEFSPALLTQAKGPEEGVEVERLALDDEGPLPFKDVDLVVSSLALHWVNDLPSTFERVFKSLRPDGAFLGCLFGGDTLFELRCSLQLASLERSGGIASHVSPMAHVRDVGSLLTRAGFVMQTVDTDELKVGYPSMLELMTDLQGMAENNAAHNRLTHLPRDNILAAASIYKEMYGDDKGVPATFQVIYFLGWKPDPSQPKPLERGSGEISIKDLYRLDEIVKEIHKKDDDDRTK